MRADRISNLIVVTDNNKKHPIDVNIVVKVKAEDGMVKVHFLNNRSLSFDKNIRYFEEILSQHGFIKINRTCLINPQHLEGIKPGKSAIAIMSDMSEEPVSREVRKTLSTYILETVYS